jgi:hypothetical protein
MGQLFNRQPRKAFLIAIITHIFGALLAHTRLLLSFWTMVAAIFGWLGNSSSPVKLLTAPRPRRSQRLLFRFPGWRIRCLALSSS